MIKDLLDKPLNEELRELKKAFKDAGVEGSLVDYLDTMELAAEELIREIETLTVEPDTAEELTILREEVERATTRLAEAFSDVSCADSIDDMAETAADSYRALKEEVETAEETLATLWGYKKGADPDLDTLVSMTVDAVETSKAALGDPKSRSLSDLVEAKVEAYQNAIEQIRDQLGLDDTDKDQDLCSLICRLSARSAP